jgi:hypothetical protein
VGRRNRNRPQDYCPSPEALMRMSAQRPYAKSNGGLAMLLITVELLPGVRARQR